MCYHWRVEVNHTLSQGDVLLRHPGALLLDDEGQAWQRGGMASLRCLYALPVFGLGIVGAGTVTEKTAATVSEKTANAAHLLPQLLGRLGLYATYVAAARLTLVIAGDLDVLV